jgi:hypothetical protein
MAAIANPVAVPSQWTPSLLKSGKPGSKSMLQVNCHDDDRAQRQRRAAAD